MAGSAPRRYLPKTIKPIRVKHDTPSTAELRREALRQPLLRLIELAKEVLRLELRYLQIRHNAPDVGVCEIELVIGADQMERELQRLHHDGSTNLIPAPLRTRWEHIGTSHPDGLIWKGVEIEFHTTEARAMIKKLQDLLASGMIPRDSEQWSRRHRVDNRNSRSAILAEVACTEGVHLDVNKRGVYQCDTMPTSAARVAAGGQAKERPDPSPAVLAEVRAAQDARVPGAREAMNQQPPLSSMRDEPLPAERASKRRKIKQEPETHSHAQMALRPAR